MEVKKNKTTITITVDKDVKEVIDKLAKKMGVNRSALISIAFDHYRKHRNVIDTELFDEKLGIVEKIIRKEIKKIMKERDNNINVDEEVKKHEGKIYKKLEELKDEG